VYGTKMKMKKRITWLLLLLALLSMFLLSGCSGDVFARSPTGRN